MQEYGIEIDLSGNRIQQVIDSLHGRTTEDIEDVIVEVKDRDDDSFIIECCHLELQHRRQIDVPFVKDDGGRADAGYKGHTGDCACRAVAIVTGRPYQEIYDLIIEYGKKERLSKRKKHKSHPRTGVYRPTMHKIMEEVFGYEWIATMTIGSGCTVHVRPDELPDGRLVLNLSKHYAAFIDGVLHDTGDSSRRGNRCVYGYWKAP